MASPYDSYIDNMFLNFDNQDNEQYGGGFQYTQQPNYSPTDIAPQISPEEEQGILADFVDKFQQGAWGAAADIVTGARGLLTDDTVWEMEQILRDRVAAQQDTLSTAQKQADANFSMFGTGDKEFTGRGFGGALFQGAGSLIPSVGAGILSGGAGAVASKALGMGAKVGQVAGGAAIGAPMIGGGAMNQVREELNIMPSEELAQLPDFDFYYQTALQQSPDDPNKAMELAREIYTQDAEQEAVKQGAALGAITMGAAVPMLDKVVRGGAGFIGGVKRGAGTEFLQEGVESGGQEAIVNPIVGRERWEGVPESAATGAILGGLIGGGLGGVGGLRSPKEEEQPGIDDVNVPPAAPVDYTAPLIKGGVAPAPNEARRTRPHPVEKNEISISELDNDPELIRQALNEGLINVNEAEQALDIIAKTPAPIEDEQVSNIPKPAIPLLKMDANELKDYRDQLEDYRYMAPAEDSMAIDEIQRRINVLEKRANEPVGLIKGEREQDLTDRRSARGVKPEVTPAQVDKSPEQKLQEHGEVEPAHAKAYLESDMDSRDTMTPEEVYKRTFEKGYDNYVKKMDDAALDNDKVGTLADIITNDIDMYLDDNTITKQDAARIEQAIDDNLFKYNKGFQDEFRTKNPKKYGEFLPKSDKPVEKETSFNLDEEIQKQEEQKEADKKKKPVTVEKGTPGKKGDLVAIGDNQVQEILDINQEDGSIKVKTVKTIDSDGNWNDYNGRARKLSKGEFVKLTGIYPAGEDIKPEKDVKKLSDKELRAELNTANNFEKTLGDRRTKAQKDYRKALIKEDYERSGEEQISYAGEKPERDEQGRTEAQKEAGNYKKKHITWNGLNIAIENEKGTKRSGTDEDGKAWETTMENDYGYIKRTKGADGDHVDVFIGDNQDSNNVYVVNQTNKDGSFDEHKVMIGFNNINDAEKAYLANYQPGWNQFNDIAETNVAGFKTWLDEDSQKKPAKFEPTTKIKDGYGENNKLFTQDAAAAARELLKKKLSQLSSGVDPEIMQAGLTLAGYHIEAGARTFADFTKAMVNDLGDGIKPFLKSFYESVRYYPGFDNKGMSTTEEIENELLQPDTKRVSTTSGTKPAAAEKPTGEVRTTGEKRKGTGDKPVTKRDKTPSKPKPAEPVIKASDRSGATEYQGRSRESVRDNYRIKSQDDLASGSAYEIAKTNLAAIKIAKRIASSDNDTALPDEKATLAKYAGWGAGDIRNNVFPANGKPEGRWKEIYDQLNELLTPAEMKTLKKSTQYAHYTSKSVVDGMYNAIANFGFKTGAIFEGGVGSGNFMGLVPNKFNIPSYTGVEMDSITADIAQALYPDNRVIKGDFTKINLPENHFDLVLGNPPFADVKYKHGGENMMLHDYFIAKQLDALKPGGVAAFVTSTGTMDKIDSTVREYISNGSVLLGAIRLPNDAFSKSAKTKVTADILFFQKKDPARDDIKDSDSWVESNKAGKLGLDINVNEYFLKNTGNMLGVPETGGTFQNRFNLIPSGDTQDQLNNAIERLPKNVIKGNPTVEEVQARLKEFEIAPDAKPSNFYKGQDGSLRMVIGGIGTIVQNRQQHGRGKTAKQLAQIEDYIPLRDALMETMANQSDDKAWSKSVKKLNEAYDNFTKKHGPLNHVKVQNRKDGKVIYQSPIVSNLEDDAEFFRVLSSEQYDEGTDTGTKGDIFTDQLFNKPVPVEIKSAEDAMSVTLNEKGYLDFDYMKSLYDHPLNDIIEELGDSIYQEPLSEKWVPADEYLSGNVKAKLLMAQNKNYERNIKALEKIIPDDLPLSNIPINLGAFWIDTDIIKQFAEEKFDFKGSVNNVIRGENSSWSVIGRSSTVPEFSTSKKSATDILDAALNRKVIKITTKDSDGNTVTLVDESTAANEKVKEMKDAFTSWALNNADVSKRLHEVYNRDFNTTVPRKYNGSMLTFPGLSSKYDLHQWQKDVVWRIIQNGNTYMAHAVGAGKTLASIVAGQELKRLGLANKPTYVVLKSTLKQFAAEFYDAYPNAKLLIADENQLNPRNRRHFLGKVANENWDGIVITHQSFEKIGMGDEFVTNYIEQQIAEYNATLDELDEQDLPNRRNIENTIEKMEARLEEIAKGENKDKGINFEETGIDQLFVDEAHKHKKVQFPTTQSDMKSIDPSGSNIAMDLFLKSRYLNTIKPNKNLVLMSGTPVTNTMNEFFNIQRYLQPDVLEQQGISSFDSWSATFAEASTGYEMQPNGKHKAVTRLNKFVGLPGFLRDFLQIADIINDRHLEQSTTIKNRPTLKNNSREIIAVPIGESMKQYMAELDLRIKRLENRRGPSKKGEDNILVVMTDGQNAAIDMRLVGRANDVPSKLDVMIDNLYNSWKETSGNEYFTNGEPDPITGSVQLIFTKTRQTKHSDFDVYTHIRDTLIKKGVPASEIAFIQDYTDSKKKKRLFNDVNDGKVRFILGGTDNLGTGTNVQKRLSKVHHLSIDYRPSDLKQRDGRMIRQGNQNKEVESIPYVAEGTIDAFMWGLLESKSGMIDKAMAGDLDIHSISDVSDDQSMLAMAKAIASGNPALLEIAELSNDVRRLRALENAYVNQRFSARNELRNVEIEKRNIEFWKDQIKDLPKYVETSGDQFNAELFGTKFTDRKPFLEALNSGIKFKEGEVIGKVGNMPIYGSDNNAINFHPTREAINLTLGDGVISLSPGRLTGELGFGAVKRIENIARNYANINENIIEAEKRTSKKEENANRILESEFDKKDELNTKGARLLELEESLKAPEPTDTLTEADRVPDDTLESKAETVLVGDHPSFSFIGVGDPAGLTEQDIFDIIVNKYGKPLFGASKFRNLTIINNPDKRWRGQYNPKTKKMELNAYYLTEDDALRVLHHEKVHEHIRKDPELLRIANNILKRAKRFPDSPAGKAYEIAKDRTASKKGKVKDYDSVVLEETLAYLVQYYNKPGHKSALKEYLAAIRKFFSKFFGILMNEDIAIDYVTEMVQTEVSQFKETEIPTLTKKVEKPVDEYEAELLKNIEDSYESGLGDITKKVADNFESDWFHNTASYAKRHMWGTLNVRQVAEILGKYAPVIKNKYIDRFKKYEADMNEMKQRAGNIANDRQKLSKDMNERLAKVQHEATIEGFDPEKADEQAKTEVQAQIQRDFDDLSITAKTVYRAERDYHKEMHDTRLEELKNRINFIEGDEGFKEQMIDKLTQEFAKAYEKGPYFPLSRYGQFWVSSENAAGEKSFDMFESETAQKRFVDELRSTPGEDVLGFGKQLDKLQDVTHGVDGKFISEVDKLIKKAGGDSKLRDDIFQLYLETLPELSSRKKYLHRKKTKGFSKDQAKAFAQAARSDANDVARIRHIHVLEDMINQTETSLNIASSRTLKRQFNEHADALQKALDETPFEFAQADIDILNEKAPFKTYQLNETADPEAEIKRILLKEQSLLKNAEKIDESKIRFVSDGLSELKASHDAMINSNVHPIASGLNSLGFLWYLGASPAAAMVNLTQTPTVALPMMLADKRLKDVTTHLAKAVKDFVKGKGTIEPTLNSNEKEAFKFWHDSGLLENTQAHDLSGIADSGIDTGTFKNKAMRMISFMFHRAEVMNREVTALATYRAAIDGGMSHKDAMKRASDLTWDAHLDYGASNRARFMRGNFARVITQFKQYSQGITYIYARTAFQAFKGETREDRVQGMKLLGMLLGSQVAVAGTLGLPMAGIVMGIAQGLTDAIGDDDDPVSVKAEFRQAMSDFAGKTGGQAISHGLIDAFTPLSVSGRLSMSDLWIRTPDYDLEGKSEALAYIEALGGPMVSIFTNMFMAKEAFSDGDYLRAAEGMTPKFIKDFTRAGRYAGEGNLTKAGLKIKDMTPAEMIAQSIGFTSSEVSEIREQSTAIKNIERKRGKRRKDLIDAWIAGEDVMDEIKDWNEIHTRDRITGDTLRKAKRSKLRYAKQVTKGVRETNRNRDLLERYNY